MKNIVIIAVLALVALAAGMTAARLWMDTNANAGVQRPNFTLPDIHGQVRSASEWDGKVVLLNFWATWCAPCRKEIPSLIQAQKRYGDQGLQILGLAVDELETVRKYAEQFNINYPLLVDAINVVKLQDKLEGGAGLPVSILIDRDGKVRERVIGEMDHARLEQLLAPYFSP